jgi:hypothetical protein
MDSKTPVSLPGMRYAPPRDPQLNTSSLMVMGLPLTAGPLYL